MCGVIPSGRPTARLLKPSEVQEILSISRTRIYEMLSKGELPTVRIGYAVRVPADALEEWIRQHTQNGPRQKRTIETDLREDR